MSFVDQQIYLGKRKQQFLQHDLYLVSSLSATNNVISEFPGWAKPPPPPPLEDSNTTLASNIDGKGMISGKQISVARQEADTHERWVLARLLKTKSKQQNAGPSLLKGTSLG